MNESNNLAAQPSDEPMRELPESWRTSDISWICSHLKEHTIFDVERLQREWNEMKALAIEAAATPRTTADVERDGYVLVPIEPTDAMMDAMEACSDDWPRTTWKQAWAAAIAATKP